MIGERIYQLRTEKGMSQGDLAEMLNVSRQSISKWENNTATPELSKLIDMSSVFEVSLDELVYGKVSEDAVSSYNKDADEKSDRLFYEEGFIARVIGAAGIAAGVICFAFVFDIDASFCLVVYGALGIVCLLLKNDRAALLSAWGVFCAMRLLFAGVEGGGIFAVIVLLRNGFGGNFWLCEWQMMQILMLWGLVAATVLYLKKNKNNSHFY